MQNGLLGLGVSTSAGEEFEIEHADAHITHVIWESRRELGMKELEGRPAAIRGSWQTLQDPGRGDRNGGVSRMAGGEAQLPERRGREPDFEKIGMVEPEEEAGENARGILE